MSQTNTNAQDGGIDTPVARSNRYASLDILRGFAVLAIFAVNIKAMFAPFAYYANASLWTGSYDMIVATLQAFFIDDKFRTIFTALFGAGIILIAEKTAAAGGDPLSRLSSRNLWLLLFGLIHLIGIWMGDILTNYAITGFIAMLFWKKSTRALWIWAIGIFIVSYIWMNAANYSLITVPQARDEVMPILWLPGAEELRRSFDIFLAANPMVHVNERAMEALGFIPFMILGGFTTMTLSIMLMGMALWKNGFLKGEMSAKTYMRIALIGLAIAFISDAGRWIAFVQSGWRFEVYMLGQLTNLFNGLAGGIGYAALIMAGVAAGRSFAPIAMVGRMAFTNYIACSLIGTTLAYGHGFSLFGKLSNLQMMGIVALTWISLIMFSMAWLSVFRFGPLEWLWRSLSYGRAQPILK